jgi:hypothetical protein
LPLDTPPTNRQAVNVARNAIHTLVKSSGSSTSLMNLAASAQEEGSDLRYSLAVLSALLQRTDFLEMIESVSIDAERRYCGLPIIPTREAILALAHEKFDEYDIVIEPNAGVEVLEGYEGAWVDAHVWVTIVPVEGK